MARTWSCAEGRYPLIPAIARERLTDDVLETEQAMLEKLQRHSVPYLHTPPESLWEWVALAQHHGVPTRLLDWSINPLTALWFTVRAAPQQQEDGVVWILRPDDEDYAEPSEMKTLHCKRHAVFAPRHVSERITAQVAWFTMHKRGTKDRPFEPLEESAEFREKLTPIVEPADRFAHLRFQLDTYGVNSASVFPGLDGLCAHIKWENCFLPDELPPGSG